jgi:prepilin-type N-terminal cleavage/methylation domain-containing protein
MMRNDSDDLGFGLIELVIAMFLLAIVALAILPVMVDGIRFSSEQSTVATATRQLNSLVDQARDGGTCGDITDATMPNSFSDGAARNFSTAAENTAGVHVVPTCVSGTLVSFTLVARQNGKKLAQVEAKVYVP